MGIKERLAAEELQEAKRRRVMQIVLLVLSVIVIGFMIYQMSRPQKSINCTSTFSTAVQGSATLHTFGGCN